ncbi:uncharacterized protein LOC128392523 [Panonychus citri]|uniref:uncharacterized protein LOC128392523 n=1 Tax=Panonychus citri TaxID=50023 RepID=UPI0023077857|nr:uncharacterized protein LOC128392523 [Panonychus citri]
MKFPTLNNTCKTFMELVTNGTHEKYMEDIDDCMKNNLPENVYDALVKCENILPFRTNEEVTKACSGIEINSKAFEESIRCKQKTVTGGFKKYRVRIDKLLNNIDYFN